ncbi:TRAP transporter large permease subunit [Hoeflea sp.]|uniref:TRAP transporter large permease n=1 Tax=Hoeflea sp. TaxID=1940281 RepID=UPI0019943ABA|nr:TRAP transporter large permease subunit [Hoeflea sp.]MBC7285678.1 TRAP transporter large permease subunit [Hoeflea sp.]
MEAWLALGGFIAALLVFLSTGTPVAVSMGLIAIGGLALFVSWPAAGQLANIAYAEASSFILIVVPLFVFMGEVLARSGLGETLFAAGRIWLRRLPGASALGTIAACTAFASVSGSSPVTAATVGAFAIKEMDRQGYARRLSLGATAAGGTLGILIPPSVPMILYGVLTETSIAALFIAGILPGLMLAILLGVTVIALVLRDPSIAPADSRRTPWPEKLRSLLQLWPILLLIFGVIGSIYAGLATPTEAAAVGAVGAMVIAASRRRLNLAVLREALDGSVRTTAMFLLLLISGLLVTFLLARLGIPQALAATLTALPLPPWGIMACIVGLLILLGFFMDPLSILVIVVPIFFPVVTALGYDPVWFGIVVTLTIEIAAITPPVGFNLFVLRSVVPGAGMQQIAMGAVVFVIPMLVGLVLLFLVPEIALWLVPTQYR